MNQVKVQGQVIGLVTQVRALRQTKNGNVCLDLQLISLDSQANGKFYEITLFNEEARRKFNINDLVLILGVREKTQFTNQRKIRLEYTWMTEVFIGENEVIQYVDQNRYKEICLKKMKYLNKCTGIYKYFKQI